MPARQFSVNLVDAAYPLRSDLTERPALADEILNRTKPKIQARVTYMDNVLPCIQGYDSLDSVTSVPATVGALFDKVYPFYTSDSNQKAFFSPSYGKAYILVDGQSAWSDKLNLAGDPSHSIMYLRDETYFYFRNYSLYKYDEGTDAMVAVATTGLNTPDILGVTSASNYAIAYSRDRIYYSNALEVANAIDFTPALGVAGSLAVLAQRGPIVTCLPYANGFIIYTQENAIMASYSGNPNNPFIFREIPGSSGVLDEEMVAWDTNIGAHFAYTRSGVQSVTPERASNAFPDVLDMLRQKTLESYNEDTGVVSRTENEVDFATKITLIAHRFLCLSYGIPVEDPKQQTYAHAFIYDLDLKRWGRITEEHVDVFMFTFTGGVNFLTYNDLAATTYDELANIRYEELTTLDPGGAALAYRIGLLSLDGTVRAKSRANMAGIGTGTGILVLDGFAVRNEKMTTFNEIRCKQSQLTKIKIYASQYDDPLVAPDRVVTPALHLMGNNLVNERYLFRSTARNHKVLMKGRFHLTDMDVWMDEVGER